jgi:hypothetical protein
MSESHDLSQDGIAAMDTAQLSASRCNKKCSDPEFQEKGALTPNFGVARGLRGPGTLPLSPRRRLFSATIRGCPSFRT